MVKIGLLSDTHGSLDATIFSYFEDRDEVWHAGDFGDIAICEQLENFKPVRGVYGNIDDQKIRQSYPLDLIFELEGVKVYMTHIGGYPGHYSQHARQIVDREQPGLFICGHSHILKVMKDTKRNNMLTLNPGAIGHQGFHKMRTALRFDLADGQVQNMEALEFGKRGKGATN